MKVVWSVHVSISFWLLFTKRLSKAIFSFNSIFSWGGTAKRKLKCNFSRYSNYHYIIPWRASQHSHDMLGAMNPRLRRPLAFYPTKLPGQPTSFQNKPLACSHLGTHGRNMPPLLLTCKQLPDPPAYEHLWIGTDQGFLYQTVLRVLVHCQDLTKPGRNRSMLPSIGFKCQTSA